MMSQTNDNDGPLISVIVIFLNAAPFMQETFYSVLNQSYRNWELILVDDGATDGGTEIAQAAVRDHPKRIRYFQHDGHVNLGTSVSRNVGLSQASGDYVIYLDADDILLPHALERMAGVLDADLNLGAVFAATMYWFWDPLYAHQQDVIQIYGPWNGVCADPPEFLVAMTYREELHPANCSTLFRRKTLNDVGGFERAFPGMYEDTVLLAKVLLTSKVFVTDEVLSIYRMHHTSQCHQAAAAGEYHNNQPNTSRGAYLAWMRAYVRERCLDDAGLGKAIDREMWPYRYPGLRKILRHPALRSVFRRVKPVARALRLLPSLAQTDHTLLADMSVATSVRVLSELENFYERIGKPDEANLVAERARALMPVAGR